MSIDVSEFSARSDLIFPELEEQLKQLLDRVTEPVCFTCLVGDDPKSGEMAAFLNHMASLSPRLSCRFLAPGEDGELDKALDGGLLPAAGVSRPGELPRMVFHGVPGGKEINTFAASVLTAGGGAKPLDKPTLKDIGKIKKPLLVQVCVSLGCHHCAQLAVHAQRVAWENPLVSAHVIDANLYPDLVREYALERVPVTVVNRKTSISGGKTMAELTTWLAKC